MVPVPDWYEFTFSAQTSNLPVFPQEVFDDPNAERPARTQFPTR